MRTEILHEDSSILVVYKPAGLAAQTAKVGQQDVVSELKNYLQKFGAAGGRREPYLGIVHRVDQPVEGLLVFAKDKKAAASLSGQLQRQGDGGTFHKHYYAVLYGQPAETEGELVNLLYKTWDNRAVVAQKMTGQQELPEAKKAVLYYRILQVHDARARLSLADIEIRTGRFHQIRIQMSYLGVPLLGDMKYGSEEAKAAALDMGIQNVALCAYSLEFIHPVTKEKMLFRVKPKQAVFSYFSQL